MKQILLVQPQNIIFQERKKPESCVDEVVVAIKHIGICGSDIQIFNTKNPFVNYPVVPGHECSGIIESVGKNIKNLFVGQFVTLMPQLICGKCFSCLRNNYHVCDNIKVFGFQVDGIAQEYFCVSYKNIIPLPKDVSLLQGVFVEPLAVGIHAISQINDVKGKNIVVIGAGPIGNVCAQAAKASNGNVIIIDIDNFKLNKAKECGISQVINVKEQDFNSEIKKFLKNNEIDVFIECSGTSLNFAIDNVRKKGEIIIIATFKRDTSVDVNFIQFKEINIKGSFMYKKEDFIKATEYIANKKCIIEPLFTQFFSFENYLNAYELINNKKENFVKVIINL